MGIHSTSATDLRLLLPETLWLEPERFEQAREISSRFSAEPQQWQAYLNVLALLTLEALLQEWLPDQSIHSISYERSDVSYLEVGEFRLCLIAKEHVLDEVVSIPKEAIEHPELAAHFYIVLEVLEDQEQVVTRGFLRYDELIAQANRIGLSQSDTCCLLPLSVLDMELNHLVLSVQYSTPSAIPLPTVSTQLIEDPSQRDCRTIRILLNQWLQGVLDEGRRTIDTLVSPANLDWSACDTSSDAEEGKMNNLGMQFKPLSCW